MDLHVEVSGEGRAVLLAHGFAGSARNFRPQVRALRDRCQVITYDARGHARSPAPPAASEYGLDRLVADMAEVLDRCGVERAVVGGLSLGAAVALHFALAHPDRVDGMVLAALPGSQGDPGSFASRSEDFAAAIEREGLEAAGDRFVWGERSGLDPAAAKLVRLGFLEHPPHALAHLLRNVLGSLPTVDELAPRLRELAQPALVIVGGDDRPSLGACHRVAQLLPDAQLHVVPGAGHVVNLEAAGEFNEALVSWLEAL